jgi:hypothetical protein
VIVEEVGEDFVADAEGGVIALVGAGGVGECEAEGGEFVDAGASFGCRCHSRPRPEPAHNHYAGVGGTCGGRGA